MAQCPRATLDKMDLLVDCWKATDACGNFSWKQDHLFTCTARNCYKTTTSTNISTKQQELMTVNHSHIFITKI